MMDWISQSMDNRPPEESSTVVRFEERVTENFQRSLTVGNRSDLARLCNTKGLKRAVEIGTDRGLFALEFLNKWSGEILYCIDMWERYAEMPWDRSGDFHMALLTLAPHASRVRIVREDAINVARYFGVVDGWPKDIDFVYIDGAHDYESVKRDIELWWPIVRQGGILAGDDFGPSLPGVMQAVREFAESLQLKVDLTTDYNRECSWYVEKY